MPKYLEVSGPAAIVLSVRDTATAAEFYEKLLGFRRDPEVFPNGGVGFLTRPSSFAVIQAPPGVDLESLPRPIHAPAIWFKTSDSQVAHDALVEAGVTILRPPQTGGLAGSLPSSISTATPSPYTTVTRQPRDGTTLARENDGTTRAKRGNTHDRAEQFHSPVCPT